MQSLFDKTQLKSPANIRSVGTWGSKAIISELKKSSLSALLADPDGAYICSLYVLTRSKQIILSLMVGVLYRVVVDSA